LEEMDLDEILRRKPKLVLVDELAHTNVPGSRHEKRYQDVQEILEAGINVYSTMNVQHLESRSDVIGLITATQIRETVPDSIMDWVDQIELVDLTPEALLERLKEGKVYPRRKVDQALQYFFQEKHLSTLREIVLRVTADKVDRDTRGMFVKEQISKPSTDTEKLLVAVSPSPHSDRLIRMSRRLVEDLEISWVAVHVDTGEVLDTERNNQLIKNLELARELGAETVTLHGTDIVPTISEYAKEHGIIQIVIGRPETPKFWQIKSANLVQRLIANNPQADIMILQQWGYAARKNIIEKIKPEMSLQWKHFAKTGASLLATTLASLLILPLIGYRAVGFLYLLNVVILSIYTPFSIVLVAAAVSALVWNYLFIPPRGTFVISAPEDIMMCMAYFVISSVTAYLTAQIRKNQNILKAREETTQALYDLLKSMTFVKGQKAIVSLAVSKIESLFAAECCILIAKSVEELSHQPTFGHLTLSENDRAVAIWAFEHGKMAGWSTDTLSASKVLCLTLKFGEQKFGVLAFKPKEDRKLNPEQHNLLISITNQISVALVKERYEADSKEAVLLKESEKLHQTLLNCISHELRTPLTSVMGAATALQEQVKDNDAQSSSLKSLSEEIFSASEKMNHAFAHLRDSTIEVDTAKLQREWAALAGRIHAAFEGQKKLLKENDTQSESLRVLSEEVVSASERLNHVFENLLDMTRLESGIIKLREEWFDLAELLSFTVDRQKRLLSQHRVQFEATNASLYFYGDYDLLEHAFANLLLNAAKYSPSETTIKVTAGKPSNEFVVSIKDQGPGIPTDLIPHIFEKFYRLPGTPSGGLGLGLSISKNLIELHGGKIEVENLPKGGAAFSVILPYHEPPSIIQEETT